MNLVEQGWLFEKEMEQILGLVYEVRNKLGAGRTEEIYHQALVLLLSKNGIPFQSKPHKRLVHRGQLIHTFEPDLIIWDKIILELKVLKNFRQRNFPSQNQVQLLQYLKFYGKELGALINFAHSKVGICRMIYEEDEVNFDEDFKRMMPHVSEGDKDLLRKVLTHIKHIGRTYGSGYWDSIYHDLIATELRHHGIMCKDHLHVPATFQGHLVGTQSTPCILVEGQFLLYVKGQFNGITAHDFLTTRTFLEELKLKVGWVINFGQDEITQDEITIKATASKAQDYPYQ